MPHYLYGIVPADASAPSEPGVSGELVSAIGLDDQLAVLASQTDERELQPRRAHLLAHDRVLAAAMAEGPVLPFRFGLVADDDPRAILDELDVDAAVARMRDLADRVEVQLLWEPDTEVALRRVAARHPQARDQGISRIERGRLISAALSDLAVEDLEVVREELGEMLVSTGPVEPHGSSARVAVLVDAPRLETFLDRCEGLAGRVASAGELRTVGALPPYSFAELDADPVGV